MRRVFSVNIILFIGNGINRVEGVAISWDDLLGDLSSEKTRILSDYLGMTLRFEYIDAVSPNKAIDIKRAVAKKTQETALQIIQKLQPRQAFLTHVSHEMGLYAEVAPTLPENVFLGIDNLTIDVL